MRKLLFLICSVGLAQSPYQIQFVTTNPSGACTNPGYMTVNKLTGAMLSCVNGTWTAVGGGGGGGSPGGLTGQIQYNNSGTFGGIATTGTGNAVLALSPTLSLPLIQSYTIGGTLPSAGTANRTVWVTNGATATDCTTGGGTLVVLCRDTGTLWAAPTASVYSSGPTGTTTFTGNLVDVTTSVFTTIPETQYGTHSKCVPASGSGTAYVCTLSPIITSYSVGMNLLFIPDIASTGPVTLDAGGGAKKVFRYDGATQASTNDLVVVNGGGIPVMLQYQSSLDTGNGGWVLQGSFPSSPTLTGTVTLPSNGAASTPILYANGTWFSGGTATTTKPYVLVEPVGSTSTAWSIGGTALGVNSASGFAGNLADMQQNGISRFSVGSNGLVAVAGDVRVAAGQTFYWTGRSKITSPADGQVAFKNQASSVYADLFLRSTISVGTVPGISGCSATIAGAPSAGEITSGTTGSCDIVLTFVTVAPNGWVCRANDITTPTTVLQTATSVTTTTASLSGTTTTGDKIRYACVAY